MEVNERIKFFRTLHGWTQEEFAEKLGMSPNAYLNQPVLERLYGGLALAVIALSKGAKVIRTHDVAPTVEVLKTVQAVLNPT